MAIYKLRGVAPRFPQDRRYWVAPTATLVGDVSLGVDASVWFNVVARADHAGISIGDRSNVQENAVLHVDPDCPVSIGSDTTIGHAAIIHGCTIGSGVIVGMGAIVMNKAVIGDGSIVAAGAIVTEGKEFPPNSLIVGAPAKVMRELDPESAQRLAKAAAKYVENWQAMSGELEEVSL